VGGGQVQVRPEDAEAAREIIARTEEEQILDANEDSETEYSEAEYSEEFDEAGGEADDEEPAL
jgi:hypothetical protein